MSSSVTSEPLSRREREAWSSVLVLADTLRALVSGAVAPATGLSSADYLVLNRLSAAPENRLSGLKALAAKLNWSPSRLSHQLKRMETRGLVERVYQEGTGQVTMTATPAAEQTMRVATALHDEAVRRYFLSLATDEELDVMVGLAARIRDQRANLADQKN
ncbi:MAG TPA: MarR family winged helix-turn-helix transcriptional regulator [Pseudonocardia sp.]|uniref:MarR family winged helix-turn-helix transcriptional regulator n=1 Tax=Pseudonocardia sp. TaxID=60912 RepID=UPI002C3493FE|nr:MarR family winged helix-turn-helix transcriptional regulator [Pseudonocardia sp.]HTF50271.1 MarR family winged helix-turn-helix transcriptional regulator [Pseudonocardia sp.]